MGVVYTRFSVTLFWSVPSFIYSSACTRAEFVRCDCSRPSSFDGEQQSAKWERIER